MSDRASFFGLFVDDPRWELGAVVAGIGVVTWYQGTPGEITALSYIAIGMGLAGLLVVALAAKDAAVAARLSRNGVDVQGRVISIKRVWPSRSYALRYRFRDSHGAEVEGRRFLAQIDAFDWREGEEGPVRFDARNPARSVWLGIPRFGLSLAAKPAARPATPPPASRSAAPARPATAALPTESTLRWRARSVRYGSIIFLFFLFTALALAVMTVGLATGTSDDVGGYLFYALIVVSLLGASLFKLRSGWREAAEGARVLREGVAAPAVVLSVEEKLLRGRAMSISIGWIVSYSYTDREGNTHFGDSGFLSRSEAARWRTGDRCPVMFEPDKPQSSVWADSQAASTPVA